MHNKNPIAKVFEITYDDPTILEGNRWAVYANFRLVGANEKKVHNDNIYFVVCSPEYKENPSEEIDIDDMKTVILPFLDKTYLKDYINNMIDTINKSSPKSWAEYYSRLEASFYIDG
jgi:hypothetical protein